MRLEGVRDNWKMIVERYLTTGGYVLVCGRMGRGGREWRAEERHGEI